MTTFAMGCDQDELNSKVMELSSRLHDSQPVPKEMILENLGFVYDEASIREKYKKPQDFQKLWSQKVTEISGNTHFMTFADLCKTIYAEGTLTQKSAIHMLFEKVSNKVQDYSAFQKKRSTVQALSPEILKQKVQEFLNVDRVDTPPTDRTNLSSSSGAPIKTH